MRRMKEKKTEEQLTPEELAAFPNWKKKTSLFLLSQTVSLFGSSLVQFAIIWYVTLRTQSGGEMAAVTICGFLPQIVVSLFSGVWADRFPRKRLIMGADAVVATATFALAMFFLSGHDDMWMIYLVSAVRSLGTGVQTPAVNAMLPQIVPPKRLIRIGGLNASLNSITFLLSPAVGGAILNAFDFEYTLFVDITTAILALTIMSFIKVPLHKKAREKTKGGYFDDMKAGMKYVLHSPFLRTLFIFFAIFMFMVVPAAQLTPLMVARNFGGGVLYLSYTEIAFSAGSIVGGVIITMWGGFKNRMHTVALAAICFGVLTVLLGLTTVFYAFIVIMVVTGVAMPWFATPAQVLLQEQVDQNMQGRIFSLVQIVMTSMMPLGMVIFGPMADRMKVEYLLFFTGAVMAALGILVLFNRHFKRGVITD